MMEGERGEDKSWSKTYGWDDAVMSEAKDAPILETKEENKLER